MVTEELEHLCCEERLRLFSLEQKRLRGIMPMCRNSWRKDAKKTGPGSFQWFRSDKAGGSDHKLENRRIPLNKQTLSLESDAVLLQVAQWHDDVSSHGDVQKLSGHGHGQLAVNCPAWAGDWTRWPPESTSNFNHSVYLFLNSVVLHRHRESRNPEKISMVLICPNKRLDTGQRRFCNQCYPSLYSVMKSTDLAAPESCKVCLISSPRPCPTSDLSQVIEGATLGNCYLRLLRNFINKHFNPLQLSTFTRH